MPKPWAFNVSSKGISFKMVKMNWRADISEQKNSVPMLWKWPHLDPFFCAAPWLSIHQFRLWTWAYTCTCLRLQKKRKPSLQLLYTQTSEDILGMTLPHDNLFTRRDGKVPRREHISFLDLSTLVRWLWWSCCHLQRVETHIKKSLLVVSVHSMWTLVSAQKGTQNSS